jgi:hypothetical protein
MKKLLFLLALAGSLYFAACSNDFDVAAPWKDIPVVYGLLNIQDSAHYIRVEKAYLDPDANALDLAKIADSLYYDNVTIQLERVSNGQVFTLQRVDGNLEGYPRKDGIFANAPNYLYKIDSAAILLKSNEAIRLKITRGDNLPEVTAEAVMLGTSKLAKPDLTANQRFDFDYDEKSVVSWIPSGNARIFDVILNINYAEFKTENPSVIENKSFRWVWAQGVRNENNSFSLSLDKLGLEFYQILADNLDAQLNIQRVFKNIDVVIIAGGESLEKYVNVALANTGITGSQEIPVYTNLSEGRGVFSSISTLVAKNVPITVTTRDSLRMGIYTKTLNFQ